MYGGDGGGGGTSWAYDVDSIEETREGMSSSRLGRFSKSIGECMMRLVFQCWGPLRLKYPAICTTACAPPCRRTLRTSERRHKLWHCAGRCGAATPATLSGPALTRRSSETVAFASYFHLAAHPRRGASPSSPSHRPRPGATAFGLACAGMALTAHTDRGCTWRPELSFTGCCWKAVLSLVAPHSPCFYGSKLRYWPTHDRAGETGCSLAMTVRMLVTPT